MSDKNSFNLDLIADLIAGGKKELNKTAADKARERAEKQKAQREAKAREKNRAKYSPIAVAHEDPDFIPVSQTVQIILQSCDECGSLTQYVGAVTLREKHKRLPAFREVNKPLNSTLPLEIRYHEQRVPMCACCLKTLSRVGDFVSAEISSQQLNLF